MSYVVRSVGPADQLMSHLRTAIPTLDRDVTFDLRTLETQVNESLVQPRVMALLSMAFGLIALALAMVGLYGITSYGVAQRTSEIGIRMALGARPPAVVRLVLRDVGMVLALGTTLGLAVSLAAGRLVTGLLFGVSATDPILARGCRRDAGGGHCVRGLSARPAGRSRGSRDGASAWMTTTLTAC